jgi:hypothetical protein
MEIGGSFKASLLRQAKLPPIPPMEIGGSFKSNLSRIGVGPYTEPVRLDLNHPPISIGGI